MSESGFTPGPWAAKVLDQQGEYKQWAVTHAYENKPICSVFYVTSEGEANAELIARSPDMQEALAQAIPYFEELAKHLESSEMPGHAGNVTIHLKRMRAALAKS